MEKTRITVYHNGRVARSRATEQFPLGLLWSRDLRFYFTGVPAGRYTLELLMKETSRCDAGAVEGGRPCVDLYLNQHCVARGVEVQTEQPEDPYLPVEVPVDVTRDGGFVLRIYAARGDHDVPALYGMRLRQDDEIVYAWMMGDAQERAMWSPSPVDMHAGTTTCHQYEALLHSGVPLGGLGTGRIELLTNGTLGAFSTNNNWDIPIFWADGAFFALWTKTADMNDAVLLHPPRQAGGYGLPTAEAVHYHGHFPVADLAYDLPVAVPVQVRLRAQGAVVPDDAALSMPPLATFTFTVTNPTDAPVEASLLMTLDNLCGQGGYNFTKFDWSANYRTQYDSVDGARQHSWDGPSQRQGLHFACDRTPQDVREGNAFTEFLVACEGDGVSRCLSWNVDADTPAFWGQFAQDGTLPAGDDRVGEDGVYRPAGAVARRIRLEPGESQEIVFALCWYHHGHTTFRDEVDHRHVYQDHYADLAAIADDAFTRRQQRAEAVGRWQTLITDSTLPAWLQTKLINSAFAVTTDSIWTGDGIYTTHESPTEMRGAVGTLDQRMASHPFTFSFFPELDRLELEWFRRCQQDSGEMTHMIGNIYDKLGAADTFFCVTGWPDLSCSFIFQTYRHFLHTGDVAYLEQNFATYSRAIRWMQSTDKHGLGLPTGGHTYDYDQADWKDGAPMIFNAVNFLGALRTAMAAARRLGRTAEEQEWQAAFDMAYDSVMTHFWNGRYFRKWVNPVTGEANQNCFVAQLAGDWFVRQLGLEPLFSDAITDSVLRSIVELNMEPFYPAITMEATPEKALGINIGYIQQHEPYLGMELIYRGFVAEGLEVLRRRQEITWEVNSNPWGEALCTQVPSGHESLLFDYMTAPAGWNVLFALAGVTVDAQQGLLRFAPQLAGERRLRLPIFLQHLWLVLDLDLDRAEPVRIDVAYRGAEAAAFTQAEVMLPDGRCHLVALSSSIV